LVAGEFNDRYNAGAIRQRIRWLEKSAEGELPWLALYLIEQSRAGRLSGARLEAASCMLSWPDLTRIGPLYLGKDQIGVMGTGTGGFGGMGMGGFGGMGGMGMGGMWWPGMGGGMGGMGGAGMGQKKDGQGNGFF
jgi:hypothetical protein